MIMCRGVVRIMSNPDYPSDVLAEMSAIREKYPNSIVADPTSLFWYKDNDTQCIISVYPSPVESNTITILIDDIDDDEFDKSETTAMTSNSIMELDSVLDLVGASLDIKINDLGQKLNEIFALTNI